LARTNVTAPQDGVIKGLRYFTLGAVVPPGGALLDVVPVTDRMVIEARVQPDDVDIVHVGTPCRVRLTAYKARAHLRLEGKVIEVSATTFRDEKTGAAYYTARVELPGNQARVQSGMEVQPGMLAEVEFVGGARSPLRYLVEPISQNLGRAFKEE
jgi:HlyD family type I secretion membrane fusion protein